MALSGTGSCDPDFREIQRLCCKVEAQIKETESAALLTDVPKRWDTRSVKHVLKSTIHAYSWCKEEEEGKVSVRSRYLGDEGMKDLGEFIEQSKKKSKIKRSV